MILNVLEIFWRKKETEDSEEFANGKVVHSQEATSNESQPPVKKKVRKKKSISED